MSSRPKSVARASVMLLLLCVASYAALRSPSSSAARTEKSNRSDVVYVCACLKTKSCSCMTEAKTEGPCACGPKGGPPMKGVPRDSDWAKENREALAK